MSAGYVHLKSSLILAASFSVAAMVYLEPKLLLCTAGSIVGTVLTPDLDVDKAFIGDKIIEKRVGWLGKRVWLLFWKQYKTSCKHGRFMSHFPIFSTFVRLSYIYFMTIIPFYLIYSLIFPTGYFKVELINEYYYWVKVFMNAFFFYGLASSDLIHWALDVLTKESVK